MRLNILFIVLLNKIGKKLINIELCEYNSDCKLPKICCKTKVINFCCYNNFHKPVYIY
jgi:hypothetical protein